MRETAALDALEALERYARAFDEISAQTDAIHNVGAAAS